jgi:hypothetical protein
MTVKNGRFLNIGSKSFSVKEIEELAESERGKAIDKAILDQAGIYANALELLLKEMAVAQSHRRGRNKDLDFSNYKVKIEPAQTQVIAGKRRLKSVNVKVINPNSDFNLFDLLDAGTLIRKAKNEDNPMRFPLYDGVLVEAGGKQDAISIGKPELETPKHWITKEQVKAVKPRNLYSRVRNQLTRRSKQVLLYSKTSDPDKFFDKAVEKEPELNFFVKNLKPKGDRKVLSFEERLRSTVDVKIKLRGG